MLLLLAIPGLALAAPAKKQGDSPAALYHNYCSVCHGDKGDGNSRAKGSMIPPPRDFTTPQAMTELSRARMITAVKHGRPGTAMVGWAAQLSDAQIEAVVDYVRDTLMVPAPTADASRGRSIYAKSCSVCHGDKGSGASWAAANMQKPPLDFTSAEAKAGLSRERMVQSVTYGRPDTAMAGFGSQLSKADIEAVVDYIRASFMAEGATAGISGTHAHGTPQAAAPAGEGAGPRSVTAAADMSAAMPKGLKGDYMKGMAFYMQNCSTCHGVEGDGRGPRAYFINPKPRNFLHTGSRAAFNRPVLYEAIARGRVGTEMPAWDKVLTEQEIANVAEFVFRKFIRQDEQKAAAAKATR